VNRRTGTPAGEAGFTLLELLLAMVLGALLLGALADVSRQTLATHDSVDARQRLNRAALDAMQRITRAAAASPGLLLPLQDNPATAGNAENIRSVLAMRMDPATDLDGNGVPDADNDGDGRIDEDPPADATNDAAPGIVGIDDDNDGTVDESGITASDDESATVDDDPVNGVDDDGDGSVDEDPGADANGDGCPGICGVDDNGDGTVDNGSVNDDDEDGRSDEDWIDPLVFYQRGTQLILRTPVPWDQDGNGQVDGRDFVESVLTDRLETFRVERLPDSAAGSVLVEVTLTLHDTRSGERMTVSSRMRIGSGT
jgi:prepilin-type N-terminal cleavage/methylation domain-containing protein